MKIINPYTEILTPLDGQAILQHIELCGRVCYKSEDKITDTSAAKFVAGIIKRGHEAVLEHFDITAKDAGTMLALLKVARIATGSSPDSFIDLAGYAACAGEIVTERSCPYEKAETQTQE